MNRTTTLADLRASGRDPLAILGADRALLVDASWLARIEAGAPLMFWGEDDEMPVRTPYDLAEGVAVIDVEGPIAQRAWFCVDGYDSISGRLAQALADTRVRSVMLRLNSPGGAAAGAFEWTRRMRDTVAASGKRVVAYADEMAFSGAYAVAVVADEIVLPETGCVGSVGVIASMVSRARANAAAGVDVRVIHAGAEKSDGHPAMPIDDAAVARAQREIDQLAAVFHRWVAERRGVAPEAVAALEAGTRMGPEAVAAGLADRVLGYHALLSEMQRASAPTPKTPGAPRATTRTQTMNENTLAALAAATGETDPEAAVLALLSRHEQATATVQRLSADLSAANDRASAAQARVAEIERGAEIEAAKAAGQWSPALDGFLGSLSVEQLRAWRASAPRVVPAGEVQPPTAPASGAEADLPQSVAALVAKARESGWAALSAREKHAITSHDSALASRLRKAA